MMDLDTIRAMATEAAAKAAQEKMTPWVYWDVAELRNAHGFPFPFIGDYVPAGWELVEEHFVDSSGFGSDDEPALSIRQFVELVEKRITSGWAITQAGQFQVYVGEYRRVS